MKKIVLGILTILSVACGTNGPEPIKLNSDNCDFCKMTISNGKFGAELITQKGRIYKFDDLRCMVSYAKSSTTVPYKAFYVSDYLKDNTLVNVEKCFYIKGGEIKSPMGGNLAAFTSPKDQKEFQEKYNAAPMTWKEVYASIK